MKTLLKFAGIISLLLAVVAIILVLTSNAMSVDTGLGTTYVTGTTALFGKKTETILGTATVKGSALALIGFILIVVAILLLICGIVLPLVNGKKGNKVAGLLNLVAVFLLVIGGVFVFCVVPTYLKANDATDLAKYYKITAGWVIAGILALVAGCFALLPTAADFLGKKK